MNYEFLISDINQQLSQKSIGTDKGLAKIGDGLVNLTYSVAKSIYLSKNNLKNRVIRTGKKVSKNVLANALKAAKMRDKFAKSRANAHDIADTVEAIIAYTWLGNKISLDEIIDFLSENLTGDITIRAQEIKSSIESFTKLLLYIKKFLPER